MTNVLLMAHRFTVEKKFGSFEELKTQIDRDAVAAREYLAVVT